MAHILIVDDSPTERHFFTSILEKNGHTVSIAMDGEEGVDKAKELNPDLILMDVVMPGMNGFQATRRLNQDAATKKIPIVIVSTKDQETDRVWAKRQGAIEYITKPTKEKPLMNCVNQLLSA